jgi:glycosyltransferase involved in cell wall biosynthesis
MRVIGTHKISYLELRSFAGMPYTNYEVRKVQDFVKIFTHTYWKFKNKPHPFLTNLFWDFGLNKYELLHFFNAINIGNQPWITSFERYIPRGAHQYGTFPKENKYIDFVLKRATHSSCKKLIALSNYAYTSQKKYLQRYGKYEEEILEKTIVMHPPQRPLLNNYSEKQLDSEFLSFTIVGADFFRKGGKEIAMVFDKLLKEGCPVKLNIISSLDYGDYASGSTKEDLHLVDKIIAQNNNIKYHKRLPNSSVLELLKSSHIGLLPTYDETYGFSVLENQAAGCPVITTNGGALPEINNNEIGWMIELPKDDDGRILPRSKSAKDNFTETVFTSLYAIILEALNNRNLIKQKGEKSISHIEKNHNINSHVVQLEKIYDEALK